MVLDALARSLGVEGAWKTKDRARQILDREHGAVLIEPQTFMNLSGEPTARIAAWYKVPPARILVVVDDLDLPFGKLRMRERGSSGGHNGLKSLIEFLGEDFARLRIGIGRGPSGDAIDRVLSTFSPDEEARLAAIVDACVRGIRLWLQGSSVMAINFLNSFMLEG
jgi:peptidyl-tRNA hydrolase, PTH1 family